ncbi:hypothetical protein Tco_1069159 [Tanacetum coccineum]|uniref:Uncharacterized protein n=1 Tax=Tanacetum coccineum TaxID=301880 RepID=A0ABQ5HJM9_9ASTR
MFEKIRLIRSEKERLEVRRNVGSRKTVRSETTIRSEKTIKKEMNRLEVKRPFEVMSTSAHIDSEIISQTDRARSSRVPIPLPDDPYMIPQPLPIASSPIPPPYDPYLIVGQAHTPATIDTESEPEETPSETEEFQPLAARTSLPSSDHTPTSSDPTLVSPLTNEEFEASKPSDTRITSSHSIASSNSTTPLSPDHPLT